MKSFEEFLEQFHRDRKFTSEDATHLSTLIHILEGKKKKKRQKGEDEEGRAPKTGHEMIDPDTGFEDPLKGYPEQKRIY
tara:strand:- start:237 stop:473 length:237 start_codon:yes stop_codon:yes gene_type:complete